MAIGDHRGFVVVAIGDLFKLHARLIIQSSNHREISADGDRRRWFDDLIGASGLMI